MNDRVSMEIPRARVCAYGHPPALFPPAVTASNQQQASDTANNGPDLGRALESLARKARGQARRSTATQDAAIAQLVEQCMISRREVGRRLGISEGTVRQALARHRRRRATADATTAEGN